MKEIIAGIIIEQNRILLVDNHSNWSFPGGGRENGESELECLSREFSEELSGTKIKDFDYYLSFEGISPRNKNLINVKAYFAKIDGQLYLPDGLDEDIKIARWVGDFGKYNLAPVAREIIDCLQNEGYL